MSVFRVLRQEGGFSVAQSLIGAGILVVLALGISQLITNSLRTQRQSTLRSTRDQLISYYTGLIRNPVAKTNTIAGAGPENQMLRDHTTGTTAQAAGTWEPPLNIHTVNFYGPSNNVVVPASGLYLMENGATCPSSGLPGNSCDPAKAIWKVDIQWIAHAGREYELRAVINQANKIEGDINLKEFSFKSLDPGADAAWQSGSGGSVYRASGNVGIGTNAPKQPLHVNGAARISSTDDPDEYYMDVVPVTRVAGDVYYDLSIRDWGGIQNVPAMTIRGQDGFIGIGTTNPVANLHVSGPGSSTALKVTNTDGNRTLLFLAMNDGNVYFQEQSTNANRIWLSPAGNVGIGLADGSPPAEKLDVNGVVRATSFTPPSDARWKRDVRDLADAVERIMRLRGVSYAWKAKEFPERNFPEGREIGLIAQEVEKVFPELVHTDRDGFKSVDYMRLVSPLIEAVKAQKLQLERERRARLELEARVRELETILKR